MSTYLPRVADGEMIRKLRANGAVLVEGPKACGKTMTASQIARTTFRLDADAAARAAISFAPEQLFNNPTPILFDEWQVEPTIWNRVRREVDDRAEKGQFILTGSATPRDDVTRHSGAGRFGMVRMRPMSLFESGHSHGEVSLAALFAGESPTAKDSGLRVPELMERIVIGGWPGLLDADEEDARDWLEGYLSQVAEVDVPAIDTKRSPANLRRLLAALGRGVGQAVKLTELARDVGGESGPIAQQTLTAYLDALTRLHLLDNSEAWRPHMRSRARLRTAAVRYFVDPSLATASLDVGSRELMADPNAAGFHFEALVIRDLRIYLEPLRGIVESWRDSYGNEVDAVVNVRGGRWGAFEVKLNPAAVDEAAAALLRFSESIDVDKHGEPSVLGVITSTGYAGRRPDGVYVIPITTLGP